MTIISKIKLLTSLVAISIVFLGNIGQVWAFEPGILGVYHCYEETPAMRAKAQSNELDNEMVRQLKKEYSDLKSALESLCAAVEDYGDRMFWVSVRNFRDDAEDLGRYNEWLKLNEKLHALQKKIQEIPVSSNACGPFYPNGCPSGKKCWETKTTFSGTMITSNAGTTQSINCECSKKNPGNSTLRVEAREVSFCGANSYVHSGIGYAEGLKTDTEGNTETFSIGIGAGGNLIGYDHEQRDITGDLIASNNFRSNVGNCKIDQLKKDYTANCYSCLIVSNLIKTFMNAIDSTYNVTREAGVKLLSIGMILWLAFFVLNKISSFVSIEPMDMLQELFTFFFKCLLAFVLITSGLKTLTTLIVNPILIVGADYGIAIIDAVLPDGLEGIQEHGDKNTYKLSNSSVMDQEVFDKIMTLSKKADAAVSTNFVIGESLVCHSMHAGAINISPKVLEELNINIYFPDFWIMLCGAVIWFFAFLVVMGVNFYLLDLSFKIGFAILAMPITLGLWPFNKFKDKFVVCVKILINAAGTFMFLGITTGMSVVVINAALGGIDELFAAILRDDSGYVSRKFAITGTSFIIILFAFIYAHKLISKTDDQLAGKFFDAATNGMNSMHHMTTQAIDFAKKQAGTVLSMAGGMVAGGASTAIKSAGKKVARAAIRKVRDIGRR